MLIREANSSGFGETCEASESIIAGQIIVLSYSAGELVARKTSASADATARLAVAYKDITTGSRQTLTNATLTSTEYATVAAGGLLVGLSGKNLYFQSDQLEDGNYLYNDPLTINWANATLELATGDATVYGYVVEPAIVASKNRLVRIRASIGGA